MFWHHVILAALAAFCAGSAQAQVPRGFARPVVNGNGAAQQQRETPSGAVNAKLGMAGLHKLAQDPSTMAEVMELLKDPAAMAEAKAMMEDPAFRKEMEKIAGPLKQQMAKLGNMQAGEANAQLGVAALSRAMQDPGMLADAMRAMQDPQTMQEVRKMMQDPKFAQMMGKHMDSAKELMQGMQGGGNEAVAARMRGLSDYLAKQDEAQQLREMLG